MSAPPGTETREPLCDFCDERKALVYCRADDARLCLSCDLQVHAANAVSSRHPRSLLCDVCLAAPSSILCSTHRSLLCHNCDFDAHEGDAEIVGVAHQRRPVEPYSGCPVASELPGVLGIGEDEKCLGLDGNGSGEFGEGTDWCLDETGESLLLWEAPPVMSLDDLIVPTSARHRFQAVGVPPPPKDRNISCGKHKDEIIRQLRSMVESGPDLNQFSNHEQCISFQHVVAHNEFKSEEEYDTFWESETAVESCYEGELQSLNHFDCQDMAADTSIFLPSHLAQTPQEENFVLSHGVSNSQNHQNMDDVSDAEPEHHNTVTSVSPGVILTMTGAERDSAISRYREKRKTRRYDKHVRYESRKARAETRVRVKGRFAKIVTRDTKK